MNKTIREHLAALRYWWRDDPALVSVILILVAGIMFVVAATVLHARSADAERESCLAEGRSWTCRAVPGPVVVIPNSNVGIPTTGKKCECTPPRIVP